MPNYTRATIINAESARVGISTCLTCGAAILLDPRDQVDARALHTKWHTDQKEGQHEDSV